MKRSTQYGERDYTFGQLILTLRTAIGLTQERLAEHLGISRHAIVQWESGVNYPKADHLKHLIELAVEHQAFPTDREAEEIRALWHAAHQKTLLDEQWLSTLLGQQHSPLRLTAPPLSEQASDQSMIGPRVDWDDALDVPTFYGREQELDTLAQWVAEEHCWVVSVLGMGGIGKSALTVTLMHRLAPHFEVVIWRSLRDALTCEALLDECLPVLAPQPLRDVPARLEQRLSLLLKYLQARRVLLVLDNLETVLEEGEGMGRMRRGYEGYGRLLRLVAETRHRSCLLLTSRERPDYLVPFEGSRAPVRFLRLTGLDTIACEQLLAERELVGTVPEHERLIELYGGNPLALNIVAQTIVELFGGEIAPFLEQGETVFGSVRELLAEQFARLSEIEQTVLYWLAIVREPMTLDELLALLGAPLSRIQVLEAVEGLRRRSLLERGKLQGSFTLQSVVLEYVTERLITEVSHEIEQGRLARLIEHGLELATAREFVRQTQKRLIVAPLLLQLRSVYRGRVEIEKHLLALLTPLRALADNAQGYGPANVLTLLRELRGHLRGLDLSNLSIRGASLQGIEMQDTKLSGALLRNTVFTEAFDAIWAVAISSKGTYWAVGSRRGEVRVWQQRGQVLHLVWQAHTNTVRALAFSPDERTLVTGSWDGSVKLWDIESGALFWTNWHPAGILGLAFAQDGQKLASSADDAAVRIWDTYQGTNFSILTAQCGPVYAVAWSPDGSLLASGSFDGQIRLWEMQREQPGTDVRLLSGHTNWVTRLAFAPDGRTLASGSFDQTVKLWDVSSGRVLETLIGHTEPVEDIAWSPDGRLLASCGWDQTIWLWDVERERYRMTLHGHTARVNDIAFTPDSRSLLSGGEDGTLRVWDMASGQCVHIMQSYAVSLHDVAWSPDGMQLACAGSDRLVTIWDVADRKLPGELRGHRFLVDGVAWNPNGRLLASCGWDDVIRLWDARTRAEMQVLRDPDGVNTSFSGIAWSPDGQWLASGSYQHGVHVWEGTTGIRRWVGHTDPPAWITRVAWSPNGAQLACCGDDGSVWLWDTADGRMLAKLQGHRGVVMSVAWSPDGMQLASGSGSKGSGELFIWDVDSGKRLLVLAEPGEIVYALAWSPTGATLVSGGSDGVLRWWDMQDGEILTKRQGHQGAVQSLKISSDGRRLASCGDDGAINIWDLTNYELQQTLRRDRPYERLDISGVKGLTQAQRATLRALGAVEKSRARSEYVRKEQVHSPFL